jgi:pimeloyl-ACP methyl ester carboxylesterase
MKHSLALSILALSLLSASVSTRPAAAKPTAQPATRPSPERLTLGPCTGKELPAEARCGSYEVFENRAAQKGRKIALRVVVLPATGAQRASDAVTFFSGGPGESSVQEAGFLAEQYKKLREHRDFLFVDDRGTGGSGALDCPEIQSVQGFLDSFLPIAGVRACRERLSRQADLSQYTNDNAMDDIDEVRAALGYDRLNIIGASYGTRAELVYLRRHPDRVRTAVFEGTIPTFARTPLGFAQGTQKALDNLVADCLGDTACGAAFPNLRSEIAAVLARAEKEQVKVDVVAPETATPVALSMTRNAVAQTIRYMLYDSLSALEIPFQVHQAAQGDFRPLAESAYSWSKLITSMSQGYFLSVTCAEDVGFIHDAEVSAAVAGTFLGDFRVRQQRAACAEWPAAKLSQEFLAPVAADVPSLLISGQRDPATPSADGAAAARTLRHSKHVIVPFSGHGWDGLRGTECLDGLEMAVVEKGTVDSLDTSCVAKVTRPPFPTSAGEPEVPLSSSQIEPLAGSYTSNRGPLVIDLAAGRLRATFPGEPPFFLLPTSPTRFRLQGFPAGYAMIFEKGESGPATALTFIRPSAPEKRMPRQR